MKKSRGGLGTIPGRPDTKGQAGTSSSNTAVNFPKSSKDTHSTSALSRMNPDKKHSSK